MVNREEESEPRDMEVGSAGWVRVERGVRHQAKKLLVLGEFRVALIRNELSRSSLGSLDDLEVL